MKLPDIELRSNVQREIDPLVPEKGVFWIDAGHQQYRRVLIPAQNPAIAIGNMQCWNGSVTTFQQYKKRMWHVLTGAPDNVTAGPGNVDVVEVPDTRKDIAVLLQNEEGEWRQKLREASGQSVEHAEEIGTGLYLIQNIQWVSQTTAKKIKAVRISFHEPDETRFPTQNIDQRPLPARMPDPEKAILPYPDAFSLESNERVQEISTNPPSRIVLSPNQQVLPHPERTIEEEWTLIMNVIARAQREQLITERVENPDGARAAVMLFSEHPPEGRVFVPKREMLVEQSQLFQFVHLLHISGAQSPLSVEGIADGDAIVAERRVVAGHASAYGKDCQAFLYEHPEILQNLFIELCREGHPERAFFSRWTAYPHLSCGYTPQVEKKLRELLEHTMRQERELARKYNLPTESFQMTVFPMKEGKDFYLKINGRKFLVDDIERDCRAFISRFLPTAQELLKEREEEQVEYMCGAHANVVPIAWAGAAHELSITEWCRGKNMRVHIIKAVGGSDFSERQVEDDLFTLAKATLDLTRRARESCR